MDETQNQALIEELRCALPEGYSLGGFLSSGGQGAVFSGEVHGRPAALKLLFPETDPDFARLNRELPLLQSIDCPHLVKVLEHCEVQLTEGPTRVVAYELIDGGDLLRHLEDDAPPLSEDELLRVGCHVSAAVQALWAERIVHRDIKPANVMQHESDFVLVDVGVARHLDRTALTAVGNAVGTRGYMSPEQARGRRSLTVSSDVFSLGVTLYHLASKRHPFDGRQHNINNAAYVVPPLLQHRPDFSKPFALLVHSMLTHSAPRRPNQVQDRFARLFPSAE